MLCSKVQQCSSPSVERCKPPVPTLFLYLLKELDVPKPQSIDILHKRGLHRTSFMRSNVLHSSPVFSE